MTIGRTNSGSGGGGGISSNAAVLNVIAPVGSTVTITKGTDSKSLDSRKSHTLISNPSLATYVFQISSSKFGTWTVTSVTNVSQASKTVTIDGVYEYEVTLGIVDLYNAGYVNTDLTGGLVQDFTVQRFGNNWMTKDQASMESDHLLLDMTITSGAFRYKVFNSDQEIDVTDFSRLVVEYSVETRQLYAFNVLLNSSKTAASVTSAGAGNYYLSNINTGSYTGAIDIKSITGSYYLAAFSFFGDATDSHGKLKIQRIILEV